MSDAFVICQELTRAIFCHIVKNNKSLTRLWEVVVFHIVTLILNNDMSGQASSTEQKTVTLGIVGGGRGGNQILKYIAGIGSFKISYIVDVNPGAIAFESARKLGIIASTSMELTVKSNPVDFIIEATGSRTVYEQISAIVPDSTEILNSKSALLIFNMLDESRKMTNSRVKKDIEAIRSEIVAETERVNHFLQDINGITVGMKILAMNASVEAARSGVHGKGFGVVAEEIKSVSERTRSLAQNIEKINDSIVEMSARIDESLENLK